MPDGLRTIWEAYAPLSFVSGVVAFTAEAGRIDARDTATGSVIWRARDLDPGTAYGGHIVSADETRVVIATSRIYGVSGSEEPAAIRGLDATDGVERWMVRIRDHSPPAAMRGVVVVVSPDGNLVGVSTSDGSRAWLRHDEVSHAISTDGTCVAASAPTSVLAVDPDGSTRWEVGVAAEPFRYLEHLGDGVAVVGPTIQAFTLNGSLAGRYESADPTPICFVSSERCFVRAQHDFLCLHGSDIVWRTGVPGTVPGHGLGASDVIVVDGDLCVATTDYGIVALNADDGSVVWSQELDKGADRVVFGDGVIYSNGLAGFRVHDQSSGDVLASWLIDDPQHGFHPPVPLGEGRVLVNLANGYTALLEREA